MSKPFGRLQAVQVDLLVFGRSVRNRVVALLKKCEEIRIRLIEFGYRDGVRTVDNLKVERLVEFNLIEVDFHGFTAEFVDTAD